MKISIIVPFWNCEQWLGRCCESLKKQDGDFEFILVDDKSTDSSRDIAYEYADGDYRFTLITNFKTKGVSGARNTGIEYASGDWITFLDADDEMLDNAYEAYVSVINADNRANMHQLNHLRYYTVHNSLVLKYANRSGVYEFGNLPQMWFGVWNKVFKREFLNDIRFDETLQYGEDGLFALKCLLKDNYLHHGNKEQLAVKHRFDNKQSLSHVKKADDIHKQLQAYDELYSNITDTTAKIEIAGIISSLWGHRLIKALRDE